MKKGLKALEKAVNNKKEVKKENMKLVKSQKNLKP
jgi:hypothetical protein